ncbi:universal stress protein [Pokkaliibacter sp. CJK22405]|uniref:universal stress protein n=1 Tax=Pokkaliibacter sp. CJK22405 TaxID=3384615 RepID=UPI003985023D
MCADETQSHVPVLAQVAVSPADTLLVVVRAEVESLASLQRARLIASVLPCRMIVLVAGPGADHADWLQPKFDEWQQKSLNFEVRRDTDVDLADAVARVMQECSVGLVIKEVDSQSPARASSHSWRAPADWQLLRHCPCPVLLVKPSVHWQQGRMLAAVTPDHSAEHAELNLAVVALTDFISRHTQGQLGLISAYSAVQLGAESTSGARKSEDCTAHALGLCEKLGIQTPQLLIGQGPAEHWIPQAVTQADAALVVMGSLRRHQFSGALLGNTAERILSYLQADVLVLPVSACASIRALVTSSSA